MNPTDQPALDLDAIETRANAATKGPWGVYTFGGDTLIEIVADIEETGCGYRGRREICRLEDEPLDNNPTHREWTAEEDWAQVQADAEFVAHAPEDVDALLAEVRRLQAEIDAVQPTETDTLAAWLHWRFGPQGQPWAEVAEEDQACWEHQARAVRRAVARGGFKPRPQRAAAAPAAPAV